MYCSNNSLLRDYFHTIVAVQGNYRKKPSQSYRSHERLLWPLPYPYCSLQYISIYPKTNPLWPAIGINPHNCRPIVGTIAFSIGQFRHGRLMDHAHPRKFHDQYNVHDELRRTLYHHHKSIASTRQQRASWKYDARIFRHQPQPCQPFAAVKSIAEGLYSSQPYRNNKTNLANDHR